MLKTTAKTIYELLLSIIAPPFCSYCKIFLTNDSIFCIRCDNDIVPIISITRSITQKYKIKIFAVSGYKDPLKKLILAKRWGALSMSRQLGKVLWKKSYISNVDFDYIVPIPLHWTRFARRGFNQAQEIAQVLSNESGRPLVNILKRSKRTAYQSQLIYTQRHENVKNAFVLNKAEQEKNNYRNKHLLIVDDLMTTGSTLQSAAHALLKLKPRAITGAVVCRVSS